MSDSRAQPSKMNSSSAQMGIFSISYTKTTAILGRYFKKASIDILSFTSIEEFQTLVDKRLLNGKQVYAAMPKIVEQLQSVNEVSQGVAIIAKASNETAKYLYTSGLATCIAVIIYDPNNRMGALAHIDTEKKAEGLQEIIDSFRPDAKLEVSIIGGYSRPCHLSFLGWSLPYIFQEGAMAASNETYKMHENNSLNTFKSIQTVLSKNKNKLHIAEVNLGCNPYRPFDIMLDLESGKIFDTTQEKPAAKKYYKQSNDFDGRLFISNEIEEETTPKIYELKS